MTARDDRGFGAAEAAVASVIFAALVGLVMVAGRINVAHSRVEAATRTAARTISMARDPHAAVDEAGEEAAAMVGAGSSMCENWNFGPVVITDDVVTVTLSCDVDVDQLMVDLAPSVNVSRSATEVRDQYRSTA